MTAPVIRRQYAGKTSGPRYEAWREEFGRKWIRADLIPIPDGHIAASAGFSDISYFNRAFRARFGATPTDIRASFGDDARFPPAAADDSSAGKKGAAPVAWKRELHAHIAGKRRVRSLG